MRSRPKLRTAHAAIACAVAPSSAALTAARAASRSSLGQPAQVRGVDQGDGGRHTSTSSSARRAQVANRSPGSRSVTKLRTTRSM